MDNAHITPTISDSMKLNCTLWALLTLHSLRSFCPALCAALAYCVRYAHNFFFCRCMGRPPALTVTVVSVAWSVKWLGKGVLEAIAVIHF